MLHRRMKDEVRFFRQLNKNWFTVLFGVSTIDPDVLGVLNKAFYMDYDQETPADDK